MVETTLKEADEDVRNVIPSHQLDFFVENATDKILDKDGSVLYSVYTVKELKKLRKKLEGGSFTGDIVETIDRLIAICEEDDSDGLYIPARYYRRQFIFYIRFR